MYRRPTLPMHPRLPGDSKAYRPRHAREGTDTRDMRSSYGKKTGFFLLWLMFLSGCASYGPEPTLIAYSYHATDRLIENIHQHTDQKHAPLIPGKPILVTSFVELGHLKKTSDLGRLLAEQMASRIHQKGYTTVEVKLAQEIFIKESEGEFVLSRSLSKISRHHAAQAIVVGTYAFLNEYVYVTVKIVHANDGHVYASHDFAIPKTLIFLHGEAPETE